MKRTMWVLISGVIGVALWVGPSGGEDAYGEEPSKEVQQLGSREEAAGASEEPEEQKQASAEDLEGYKSAVKKFEESATDYEATVKEVVATEFQRRASAIEGRYSPRIEEKVKDERAYRNEAIAELEVFLKKYPNLQGYTPDALYRLADLQFEKATDDYLLADERYQEELDEYAAGKLKEEPEEPVRDFRASTESFKRIVKEYPDYRFADGAMYLLAYIHLQMDQDDQAIAYFKELIGKYPESVYVAESWIRIGEYYFQRNELEEAKKAYAEVLEKKDSALFDKAIYKLAWVYYRSDQFDEAIRTFMTLIDWSDEQQKKGVTDKESALKSEAIQYIAISLVETDWNLDMVEDPEFGLPRAKQYLDGSKVYHRDVLKQLVNYLLEQSYYRQAVEIGHYALEVFPKDPDNPHLVELVMAALMRDNREEEAFEERSKLASRFGEGSEWNKEQVYQGRIGAIRYAMNLIQDSLVQSGQWYHAEAQRLRQEAAVTGSKEVESKAEKAYATAARVYGDFLRQYPNDKDFYELSYNYADALYYSKAYERAYKQYIDVREMDVTENVFEESAAFNVVEAYTKHLQKEIKTGKIPGWYLPKMGEGTGELKEASEFGEAKQVPNATISLISAMDRYVVLDLKNPEDPFLDAKYAYQSAKVFYDAHNYPEARRRFEWIVQSYPEHEVAYFSGSLILESYRQEKDFTNLAKYAEILENVIKGDEASAIREEVRAFKLGALFKSAEQLNEKGKYEDAAEEYLRLISQDPHGPYVAKALNNAAVAYEQIRRYDSAMKLFKRVYTEYPQDPLASYSLYRVAVNQERFFDFKDAIQSYELFYKQFGSKDQARLKDAGLVGFDIMEKRRDALRSSAVLTKNVQDYAGAAKKFQTYATTYPKADDAPDAQWEAIESWRLAKDDPNMLRAIDSFIKRFGKKPGQLRRVLDGRLRIGLYEVNVKKRDWKAVRRFKEVLEEFTSRKGTPGEPGSEYAAEAQFMLAELKYREWDRIKIKGSKRRQEQLLATKVKGLQQLVKEFEKVFAYKSFDWTLAANYRVGALYQQFAFSLYEIPIPFPPGSDEEQLYRTELEDIALPLEDKAVENYEKNVQEAQKRKVTNEWTQRTLEQLNKYKPAEYPLFKEERGHYDQGSGRISRLMSAKDWEEKQKEGSIRDEGSDQEMKEGEGSDQKTKEAGDE